ncbi:hypothetical protein [Vibrio palustris]|nr:hypothetical protein [Vibrio palustris]
MIKKTILEALALIVLFAVVAGCIDLDILYFKNRMTEASVTESVQLVFLAITVYSFFRIGKLRPELHRAAYLIAAFYAVLFIRENDEILDLIYHGAWQVPALIVTAIALFYAYKGGKATLQHMSTILGTHNMSFVVSGTIMLLVFSRLYGMGKLWEALMEDKFSRVVKNVAEEGIELLCYSLIAYGAVKVLCELTKAKKARA